MYGKYSCYIISCFNYFVNCYSNYCCVTFFYHRWIKYIWNKKIDNTEKEETIKTVKNSFKKSIEITTKKILNEYKENNRNCDLIEGNELITLIKEITEKIIQPEEETFSIIDLFENFIYGLTPLYKGCKKALEIFNNQNGKKILFIISDGLLNDVDIKFAQDDIMSKTNELELQLYVFILILQIKRMRKNFIIKYNQTLMKEQNFYLIFQVN